MKYAPIIIPTLDRYEKLKTCLESLSKNTGASETDLFISLDYPPSDRYISGYEKIKNYLMSLNDLGFRSCKVFYHEKHIGAKANGKFLVDMIKKDYDRYIFTEDDNVFSPCFLDYINKGLELFEDDERVSFICGYNTETKPADKESSIRADNYFGTWGYGTWIKKHNNIEDQITRENFRRVLKDTDTCLRLYKNKPDLFRYFFEAAMSEKSDVGRVYGGYLYDNGEIAFIDHTCGPVMYINGYHTIYPDKSLVRNTGVEDGSGNHTCIWTDYDYSKQMISDDKIFEYKYHPDNLFDKSNDLINSQDYAPAKRAWVLRKIYLVLGVKVTRTVMKVSYEISKWRGERSQKK